MSEIWKRPSDLKFPVQYYKFVTRDSDKDNGKLVEYRVEDIPESRYEEACRFMVKHFVPYEPKLVARKGQDDPLVLEDYYNKYMHGIKQKVSVACLKRGSDEFVGVNILEVLGRNDSSYGFEVNLKNKIKFCKHFQILAMKSLHVNLAWPFFLGPKSGQDPITPNFWSKHIGFE